MDIFVKKVIIHQFSPDDTEAGPCRPALTHWSQNRRIFAQKIERVFSDEPKQVQFSSENPF